MNWGIGDFQFLKSGSDEPCIQPIESSHLAGPPLPDSMAGIPARRRADPRILAEKVFI
ncbi:hypothetical protein [Bordetella pertussis]|uniref:hypothetical protein n=1 Tax=Bordetella pertussis TaxID=520 RepID=UPI000318AEA6|nr:hypothetical protein [Bordetella pertussis]